MYERKLSVVVRSVCGVAVAIAVEPVADLVVDPLTGWLDAVLAGLAEGVAAWERTAEGVPDAVRIDRIARLEKLKAAAAALQAAESVRLPGRRR